MASKVRFVDSLKVGVYQGGIGPQGPQGPSGSSGTFPFTGSAGIQGELDVDGGITGSSFTGSFIGDASGLTNLPSINPFPFTGSAGILGSLEIDNKSTINPALVITSTVNSSDAAPIIDLIRISPTPSDGDYLGQIKFKGDNDANQEVVYAKITGKISDASDGSEDGLIEIANKKNGANNIGVRITSTDLKLLNGTGLEVNGNISTDGNITSDIGGSKITGSFTGSFVGSAQGDIINLTITSQTASLDISAGNFQILTLASGTDTYLEATNVLAGSVTNLEIVQPNPSGSLTLDPLFKFSSDAPYTASALASTSDVLSVVSFNGVNLLSTALKNFS